MNNLRKLYYYFGRDEKYNYIATPMQSALIAGRCGAGKTVLLNSLIVKLIQECNPSMLDVRLHGLKGIETVMWSDLIPEDRKIPHITQIYSYSIGYCCKDIAEDCKYWHTANKFVDSLNKLVKIAEERVNTCRSTGESNYSYIMSNGDCDDKYILFIVDEFQVIAEDKNLGDWFNDAVRFIASTSAITGVYIMLLSQGFRGLKDSTVQSFRIKAALPVDEEVSNALIDNNCAARERERYGVVWVKDSNNFPIRLYVPFYPETWIRKFVGYSSVRGDYMSSRKFEGDYE